MIVFNYKINFTFISNQIYTNTEKFQLNGVGQRGGNGGTHLIFIIVLIIEIVVELTQNCNIDLPQEKKTWTIHMLGFMDDIRHYVNNFK